MTNVTMESEQMLTLPTGYPEYGSEKVNRRGTPFELSLFKYGRIKWS